jgi:hypothetical protein
MALALASEERGAPRRMRGGAARSNLDRFAPCREGAALHKFAFYFRFRASGCLVSTNVRNRPSATCV